MKQFLYTVNDMARLCKTDDSSVWSKLGTLGLSIFNELDGEWYTTFGSSSFKEVRDYQIYWSSDVLDEVFKRFQ